MNNGELRIENYSLVLNPPFSILNLLAFPVHRVAAATATELLELQPVRRALFVLGRHVIALFALRALQNYVISRHKTSL